MKLSEKIMNEIDMLIDDIDNDRLSKEEIIHELASTIHGYASIIDAEGDINEEAAP